ncbi:nuclear transport factor 2 family protein [Streptomyces sp. NPDC048566]|uniref:nuclear transport factor 2 family protein n=1 Tax=Streptomyces sp. NPDC048566 TaxID=3365569 RepID=UPI00370FBA62
MTVELTSTAEPELQRLEFAALYAQAQQFYAHQLRLLDARDPDRWAETFTEDAVLEPPLGAAPVRARTGIARYGAARRRAGRRPRHWVGLLDVRPRPDGALRTRCSALVHGTPDGGASKVLYVCVVEDVLVCGRGGWRTAHRLVVRDDLA